MGESYRHRRQEPTADGRLTYCLWLVCGTQVKIEQKPTADESINSQSWLELKKENRFRTIILQAHVLQTIVKQNLRDLPSILKQWQYIMPVKSGAYAVTRPSCVAILKLCDRFLQTPSLALF
ncbi:hypothetical protein M9H77_22895 [Catharanthus roseus]|uniref:Uncharacterized protein n=1 Tax=Catharanthus roseus TaxID=4058 RepID=A0ACC0AUA6_CATRO|nr:hypothetical protein M9H77_22895 [Catharanthus roseus]